MTPRWAARALVPIGLAATVAACGSSSSQQAQQDPVSMAMQTPGIRMLVIPKQRHDLTVAIPPCSQAQAAASQSSPQIPPGSNQIVVPQGALTQTVAVQPCQPAGQSSSGGSSRPSGGSRRPPRGTSTPPPPPAPPIPVT